MLLIKIISDNVLRKYGYQYDALNRLSNSYYQKPDYSEPRTNGYNENLSYDKNGNITSLQRYGTLDVDGQTPPILIDNLQYVYDHTTQKVNQLVKVTDDTNNPNGFKDDGDGTNDADDDYAYDSNGNMISDQNKGITSITYNHLNLPIQINFGANGTITYLYNATGQKVRKRVQDATTGTTIETTTDYLDGYQYKDEELQFFPHSEGYVNYFKEHFYYVYNYTDHLGNIRLSYSKDPSTGVLKIIEENHYYPFGLKHGSYNTGKEAYTKEGDLLKIKPVLPLFATSYAYKYTGKEWQSELGLNTYDFGARNYMPDLARWANIDPLAEKSRRVSPYVFALNSPVFYVDPDGMEVINHELGTTYTGIDAQQMFSKLRSQYNNSSDNDDEVYIDSKKKKTTIIDNGSAEDTVYKDGKLIGTMPLGSAREIFDKAGADYQYVYANGMGSVDFAIAYLAGEYIFQKAIAGITAIWSLRGAEAFGGLSVAEKYGIKGYATLKKMLGGSGLQAHHLIEQRFAQTLGVNASTMESIAVTAEEHQIFTNAWRAKIGYNGSNALITTARASKEEIFEAAKEIYKNYPAILNALGL